MGKMPCTTVLVGKKAANDNSTMIARTDDGSFDVKKLVVVEPKKQPKKYKSVLSHVEIELPENPMRYTACPSVDRSEGIWAATGINAANVGMTATETITSNPRVLAADPLVEYKKAKKTRREGHDRRHRRGGFRRARAALYPHRARGRAAPGRAAGAVRHL
jgi:dipeptidase